MDPQATGQFIGTIISGIIFSVISAFVAYRQARKTGLKDTHSKFDVVQSNVNGVLQEFQTVKDANAVLNLENVTLRGRVSHLEKQVTDSDKQRDEEKAARHKLAEELAGMQENVNMLLTDKRQLSEERDVALEKLAERDKALAASQQKMRDIEQRLITLESERQVYEKVLTGEREQMSRLVSLMEAFIKAQTPVAPVLVPEAG